MPLGFEKHQFQKLSFSKPSVLIGYVNRPNARVLAELIFYFIYFLFRKVNRFEWPDARVTEFFCFGTK